MENAYVADHNSFLLLIKSDDESVKNKWPLSLQLEDDAMYMSPICSFRNNGPTFGDWYDICIHDNYINNLRRTRDGQKQNVPMAWN